MNLDNFINNSQIESFIIIDNNKLVKIANNSFIYGSHVRNDSNNIFIDSISIERINHKKDYIFYSTNYFSHRDKNILFQDYKDISEYVRNNLYLENPRYYRHEYHDIIFNPTYTDTIEMNTPIFYIDSSDYANSFCHTLCYFYSQIYYFYLLQKSIPDLLLVITRSNQYVDFLLKLLDIKNHIFFKHDTRLINKNVTYFVGFLNINFSEDMINSYFYNIIVNKTLLLENDVSNYPKKLLFLRNSSNTNIKTLFLQNRNEIVEIAKQFDYVDIDQTTYSMESTIKMVNNATHIILEGGGSVMHLLCNKNIKGIIINYRMQDYWNNAAINQDDADEVLKLVSDNMLADIIKIKNISIIHNDEEYLKTGINLKYSCNFIQLEKLITSIKNNE